VVKLAAFTAALMLACAPRAHAYSRHGAFAWTGTPPDAITVFTWPGIVRDSATGLPKVTGADGVAYWNPVTLSLYGLQEFSRFRVYGREGGLRRARVAANWLVRHQDRRGAWIYRTSFTYPRMGTLAPGWIAAQAQGNAISLLVRVYAATHRRAYLDTARRARRVFQRAVGHGGVRRTVRGHAFLDGFPTAAPALPLEDFELSILGLYDLTPLDAEAGRIARAAMKTLVWSLPHYDNGAGGPWLDLAHWTVNADPMYDAASERADAQLLALLARLYANPTAGEYASRWLGGAV